MCTILCCTQLQVCLCVCMCVCVGALVKSGLITQRSLVQIPGQEGNFCTKKYLQPISSPICKTGTWSCTGEQSALAVSHYSLMVLVGLQGAHTGSERHSQYSCELLAQAPGVCIAPAHRTCLVHSCPGLTRNT